MFKNTNAKGLRRSLLHFKWERCPEMGDAECALALKGHVFNKGRQKKGFCRFIWYFHAPN